MTGRDVGTHTAHVRTMVGFITAGTAGAIALATLAVGMFSITWG